MEEIIRKRREKKIKMNRKRRLLPGALGMKVSLSRVRR
jgi:hypothetical protein